MVSKNSSQLKTIKISKELHKELSKLGMKGDTFDMIIRRLLAFMKLSKDVKSVSKEETKLIKDWVNKS